MKTLSPNFRRQSDGGIIGLARRVHRDEHSTAANGDLVDAVRRASRADVRAAFDSAERQGRVDIVDVNAAENLVRLGW